MPTSRFAMLTALILIGCDSPAAPAASKLPVPDSRADVGVVRTKGNVFVDIDASAENTCNGDIVTLQGRSHQVFTTIETGDSIFVTVHTNFADVKGYGVPSGARYNLNNTQTERAVVVQNPDFTFEDTFQLNTELVSQSGEPNLILHLTQTVTIIDNEVTVTVTKFSLECRG